MTDSPQGPGDEKVRELLTKLETGYSLPALSVVAVRLVELASDDACSVQDLVNLIEKDPSLAIRLMKLANSVFFKASLPVTTLQQAVMRIGFHQLRIMALSLSLRDTFPMGKVGPVDYERFWRTSLYRALVAKTLAQHLRNCNPEEAFVAGLTLGIGFLVFFDIFIKGKRPDLELTMETLDELLDWEKKEFGVHHREIGEVALRFWKFPERIIACQRGFAGEGADEPLAKICEEARVLSGLMLRKSTDFTSLFEEAHEALGLSADTTNNIILTTFDEVEGIAEHLRIELNREKDLLELMERANGALSAISEKLSAWQCRSPGETLPSFDGMEGGKEGARHVARTLEAVAHEIRNPLVAVAGFARRLAGSLEPSTKSGAYARIILDEAMRLEKALTQMGGAIEQGGA